jgi:hypothetical protein
LTLGERFSIDVALIAWPDEPRILFGGTIMKTAIASALVAGVAAFCAPAQAKVWDFSFSGSEDASISGSGTLTTGATGSPYTVTGATGAITDPSGTFTISGLSGYAAADNLLYFPPSAGSWYVSFGGISFTTSGGPDFNLGGVGTDASQFNVLNDSVLDPGGFAVSGGQTVGSYNITLSVTPVPELSTWAMLGLGFAGLGLVGVRGRKAVAAALG